MVRAIRSGEMADFRNFYRQAEVLLVDDIHLLGRKNTTQEEFFHTFNTLHTAGKLLVLSANCPANALQHIEARLVSRFEWGISLPIEPLGTRDIIKLLEKKAAYFKVPITARVAEFLTQTFAANATACVRALETLLVRTQLTKNSQRHPPINVALARELLGDLVEEAGASILTAEQIISCVAKYFGIGDEELMSTSQQRGVLIPRQLAMYLIRQRLKTPYVRIGDLFSRDHSTVISACNQVQKLIKAKNSQITSSLQAINLKLDRRS